ncbi:transposable element Tcb1 transposase [Trichonephila clavipes]|uniref:Transposable element Tcb1 transposase n=1 Tax=Trichonephila clavipes TaxID=2585209 RepID=A0A8X6SBU7_TRICX|nr:transposable element Tcb1 transposase [Trichonephila clavipes]
MCSSYRNSHCRLRLTWSREHALSTPQQWSCVMFFDESRFNFQSDSRRTLIWRAPGSRGMCGICLADELQPVNLSHLSTGTSEDIA